MSALAKRAGMSRTAFAVRFAELVGEPPAHYLARCRMNEAAALLEASTATIAQIAERVGYASELGFSRAFKRFIGATPHRIGDAVYCTHLDLHDMRSALSELSDTCAAPLTCVPK